MLRNKKIAKKIWIVIAILVVPAFVLWGSGSVMRSKQEAAFAGRLFGRKVSFQEFREALEATKNQAIIQFGDNLSEIQKYLNLESQAWIRLMLLTEAKKRRIRINDSRVIAQIQSFPFFQRNGKFDNRLYAELLQYVFRTQPRIFEEQIRQNLMLSEVYKNKTERIQLSDQEVKTEYRKNNEQLSLYYICGLYADFTKDASASDEEVNNYFSKNSLQFKQPLSFNLEYVQLPAEEKDEKVIKEIFSRINKREDLPKLAKEFNLTIKETGLFGQTDPIPGFGWSPEILSVIYKTKVGEYLVPIKAEKSYYILRLKERKEPFIPDFTTIKDKVKETLLKEKAAVIAKQRIEDSLKELQMQMKMAAAPVYFDSVAKKYGLKSGSTALFRYGSYIEGIGASESFFLAAKDLGENQLSPILQMPSGFYIIKLKSRLPIDEKKFAQEKEKFAAELLLQKKQEYFTRFIEELKRKAQLKN